MQKSLVATIAGALFLLPLLASTSSGQNNDAFLGPAQNRNNKPKESKPTPRWPGGRVNVGTVPGEKGHWIRTRRELVVDANTTNTLPDDLKVEDIPFQPWAKALFEYRRTKDDRDSPHARCKPDAGPREIETAYGFEMVEFPEIQRVLVFDIGGPQTFRTIHMDGRPHPTGRDLIPSYLGHSVGWWEGDTLVVDSVGFNERNWIDAEGLMHTDQYHQTERFTRTDFNTMKYRVTVDDPGAYTAKWTAGFQLRWNLGAELFEYVCQANNMNPDMTIGDDGAPLSRANGFTP